MPHNLDEILARYRQTDTVPLETDGQTSKELQSEPSTQQSNRPLSPLQQIIDQWMQYTPINKLPGFVRDAAMSMIPGLADFYSIQEDPDKLHYVISVIVSRLQGGLDDDHRSGYGGFDDSGQRRCECFAPTAGEQESAEGVHSGVDGHGQEHADGSANAHLSDGILSPEDTSPYPDSGHQAEVQSGL